MTVKQIFCDTGPNGETLIYHMERLWELAAELPIEMIPLSEVDAELDYSYMWFKTTKPSPREVAKHAKRIYEADLSYPIIFSAHGLVMDGIHRIAKSWILGNETIAAVKFLQTPEPDEVINSG